MDRILPFNRVVVHEELVMHSAKLSKSDRLQRVHNALKRRPMTTLELVKEASVCAVNSIISELRCNGIDIECKCLGRGKFEYTLK